ncbi:hypothetical protein [Flavobacterium sp. 1]|uniref:HYC_CC_PP family protein n=1 Tax=Flavobacterium sp. 1 TaxID=2035200 RepID=UPI001E4F147F|nr:hypothetical protein [Flavobacterium sp. 1]
MGSNVGLAFNVHYCGSKIASVYLSLPKVSSLQNDKDCCSKKAVKKDSCCKDRKIVLKGKADDKIVKSFSFQFDYVFLVPVYHPAVFNAVPSFKNNLSSAYYCDANAPPLYKLYSQYLLYDKL